MYKKLTASGIALHLIVIGVLVFYFGFHGKGDSQAEAYCGPDGQLTEEQPIQSHRSYCLKSGTQDQVLSCDVPSSYSFSIEDDEGKVLKDFAITHTKPMHVIVVRKDLAYFQHLHPEYDDASGTFTIPSLTFPADGTYRIFADFAPEGDMKDPMGMPLPVTISEDVQVGSPKEYAPLAIGTEERTKTFEGVQTVLSTTPTELLSGSESMLTFTLKQGGQPVRDLGEYLGALGHSVILREETLDFIHAHPMEKTTQDGIVEFMVSFLEPGRYKVFTQFQRDGAVFTTDFVIRVGQGTPSMPGVDHSMH